MIGKGVEESGDDWPGLAEGAIRKLIMDGGVLVHALVCEGM
jgi:hypothetical protein